MIVTAGESKRKLGWIGISPLYNMMKKRPAETAAPIAPTDNLSVILSILDQWIENQEDEGACATFATCYDAEWLELKKGLPFIRLSRQDLYRSVRIRIGTYPQDSGSSMTDPVYTFHVEGVATDKTWPYVSGQLAQDPPPGCDAERPKHRGTDSFAIPSFDVAVNQLTRRGPYTHGIVVFDNWPGMNGNPDPGDGLIPMPTATSNALGGHGMCVLDIGPAGRTYTFGPKPVTVPFGHVLVMNSWGPSWGYAGFGFFPIDYVSNDNYVMERVEILSEIDQQ